LSPLATRGPVRVLLVLAVLEVVVNRVGLRILAPADGHSPAGWYQLLDYGGLFLSYFTGTLAVALLGARAIAAALLARGVRDAIAQVVILLAAGVFAAEILLDAPEWLAIAGEAVFGAAVLASLANAFGRGRDLGAQIGMVTLALPLLLHTTGAFGVHFRWENVSSEPARALAGFGVLALALAALVSPYCFAPRPFARSVAKPAPIIVAMALAACGAVASRMIYPLLVPVINQAVGVQLAIEHPDSSLAIYLLSFATLAWTLVSCAIAPTASRRQIGAGIALVVLGGNAYRWPIHFLLPLVGIAIIGEAVRHVRDEELAHTPIAQVTPPIADAAWGAYITAVAAALAGRGLNPDGSAAEGQRGSIARSFGGIHTLTTRGEGGLVTTVIVAEQGGLPVRTRIERFDGAVLALDVVVGREIDEVRGATFTLWSVPARALGINPSGPPAAPLTKIGDAELDERYRLRGNAAQFHALFDEGLRGRAGTLLAGWLAYWERDGLRYRIYPGRGSPMDLPLPLSDLGMGKPASTERFVALIELLAEAGARGVVPAVTTPPSELTEEPAAEEAS
jgi:hypothetical protein